MKNLHVLIIAIGFGLVACGQTGGEQDNDRMPDHDYQLDESGLKYYFHVQTGNEKPQLGEIVSLEMMYRVKEEILFDSRAAGMPMFLEMMEAEYPGDIYTALSMMAEGDSASFAMDAEEFFLVTAGMMQLPDFLEEGDEIIFEIGMLSIMDEEAFAQEQERMMEEQMRESMERAEQEEGLMLEYLDSEGITVQPTGSGLYYVEQEAGSGPQPQPGDVVAVHYEGRLLDGTVFDSSIERGQPIEFPLGQGRVIPGWDEGVALMRVGGRATLIIPSYLAYGERGAGRDIPPFSSLVFDVELVDIID